MRRFNLVETGESVGVTFHRGTRHEVTIGVFQSAAELEALWNADEEDLVMEEDGNEWTVGQLLNHFRNNCMRADLEELTARGWGNRFEAGLNFQTSANSDGETFLTH